MGLDARHCRRPGGLPSVGFIRKPPVLTTLFLGTTVLLTCLRDVVPGLVPALRRDPSALLSGQVWRVLSPVLVQADPVGVSITVFTVVGVVGAEVESRYGHRRWLVLYLTGALVGEAAGYAFQPHGTGTSVAGCGARARSTVPRPLTRPRRRPGTRRQVGRRTAVPGPTRSWPRPPAAISRHRPQSAAATPPRAATAASTVAARARSSSCFSTGNSPVSSASRATKIRRC